MNYTLQQIQQLVDDWFEEIRRSSKPDDLEESQGFKVTELSFFAPHEAQWAFLNAALDQAKSEEELGYVAAFVFEQLMSVHGELYIDEVEVLASKNEKFRSMVKCSWQHMMTNQVWRRIQSIQGVKPVGIVQKFRTAFSRNV